jgi:hypothetical protein
LKLWMITTRRIAHANQCCSHAGEVDGRWLDIS